MARTPGKEPQSPVADTLADDEGHRRIQRERLETFRREPDSGLSFDGDRIRETHHYFDTLSILV